MKNKGNEWIVMNPSREGSLLGKFLFSFSWHFTTTPFEDFFTAHFLPHFLFRAKKYNQFFSWRVANQQSLHVSML